MCRLLGLSCLLLTLLVSTAALADNSQVHKLQHQVKVLREEEETAIKHIRAHYRAIIGHKKLDEREREQLRRNLLAGERQALAFAKTEKEKEKIRAHYNHLRRVLSGEIRLDAEAIRRLREQETHHIRHVQALYHAKIMELEQLIRAAGQVKPVVHPRKK